MKPIILASSSPARRQLIEKLGIQHECLSPDVDETPLLGETAEKLVSRLALSKAQKISTERPDQLIIGCDQVASFNNKILGKPHDHKTAVEMLTLFSGQTVNFLTGLCLLDGQTQSYQRSVEPYLVTFKTLSNQQIESYLHKDQPYHCAGSIKVESLGIALLDKLEGRDPNGLIGLPLIKLTEMLENIGVSLLAE